MIIYILSIITIIILAPVAGGIISGIDRIITAKMQGRQGPPLLQPFYDVFKLFQKETAGINLVNSLYIHAALVFVVLTTVIMLTGGDILLAIFALTLGGIFFVLGGYASGSPYSVVGAERELLQMMAYEPMLLLAGIGLYYVDKSFFIRDIIATPEPAILTLPGVFLGLIYILTFKLRKSPFDFSMGHHGHQEVVQGLSTEYSGSELAVIEIIHWYETVIIMTFVFLFFTTQEPISYLIAAAACVLTYFFEILIDNACARTKWQFALASSWTITGVLGVGNLVVLSFLK